MNPLACGFEAGLMVEACTVIERTSHIIKLLDHVAGVTHQDNRTTTLISVVRFILESSDLP